MNKHESALTGRRLAIIAYTGTAAFAPLRLLHRRYRHCLVLVQVPPYWIAVDSVIGRISYAVLDLQGVGEYLIALHGLGYHCQLARTQPVTVRRWRPMPLTCVEVVKRTLGMDDLGVWTPYQLFQRIKRTN